MVDHGLPVLYALLLWWFSTGLIAWLDGLPRWTFPWSFGAASGLALAGLVALAWSADRDGAMAAYVGFTGALLVWGWNEVAFLLGYITGPNRSAAPAGVRGFQRLRLASGAVLWHEAAIALSAGAVVLATGGGPNQTGAWTFLLFWVLRLSAKLNVFLGVANLSEEFLPPHLAYLATHFKRAPMNPLFPLSVTALTIGTVLLGQEAGRTDGSAAESVGATLLAALTGLALLEHWLMVLPVRTSALWSLYLGARRPAGDDVRGDPDPLRATLPPAPVPAGRGPAFRVPAPLVPVPITPSTLAPSTITRRL